MSTLESHDVELASESKLVYNSAPSSIVKREENEEWNDGVDLCPLRGIEIPFGALNVPIARNEAKDEERNEVCRPRVSRRSVCTLTEDEQTQVWPSEHGRNGRP